MPWIHGSQEVHVTLNLTEIRELYLTLARMKHEGRLTITVAYQEDDKPIASLEVREYVEQDKFETIYKS